MQRGQSTVEYTALLVVVLITACALVRFSTPVQRLAIDVVHAIVARPHRQTPSHPGHAPPRHHRPAVHRCLCQLPSAPSGRD
jgi:hypothetical protein